jgi:hypothetical protein
VTADFNRSDQSYPQLTEKFSLDKRLLNNV